MVRGTYQAEDRRRRRKAELAAQLARRRLHGRCHACAEYLRRRGVERPYVEDGRKEKFDHIRHAAATRRRKKMAAGQTALPLGV